MDSRIYKGSFSIANKTAVAGTAITGLVWPMVGAVARIVKMVYICSTTAHTLSILRSQGTTVTTAASAAGASTLTIDNVAPYSGENLAASDYIVVKNTDGSFNEYIISSINTTTKVVTITGTLAKAVSSNATVWAMYEVARTAGPNPSLQYKAVVSVTNTFNTESEEVGIAVSGSTYEPLLIHSDNATAAGTLQQTHCIYGRT